MSLPKLLEILLCPLVLTMSVSTDCNTSIDHTINVGKNLHIRKPLFCASRILSSSKFFTCPLERNSDYSIGIASNTTFVNSTFKIRPSKMLLNMKTNGTLNRVSSIMNSWDEYNLKCQFWKRGGIVKRLKKLKFKRMLYERKAKAQMKIELFILNNFPTSHSERRPMMKNEIAYKTILDDIENEVNRAARNRNASALTRALTSYQELSTQDNYPTRMLVQMAEALSLSYHFSNSMITFRQAVDTFKRVLLTSSSDDVVGCNNLFKVAGLKSVSLLRSVNLYTEAIMIQTLVGKRCSEDAGVFNTLGSIHLDEAGLWKGIYSDMKYLWKAKDAFSRTLKIKPGDEYAVANLGYISYFEIYHTRPEHKKVIDDCWKRLEDAIHLILSGFETKDVAFRLSLRFTVYVFGEAMRKTGNVDVADQLFEVAAKTQLFSSFWQRSGFYPTNARAKPIWKIQETKMDCLLHEIRSQWKSIRKEAKGIYKRNLYAIQNENIKDTGNWEVYVLYNYGRRVDGHCIEAPVTCRLFEELPQIANNRRGAVKFSLMQSGTHVLPHSGPTSTRLRVHLGLDVPEDNTTISAASSSRLRVLNEYLKWRNGELFIFDDSFDHEVWHFNQQNQSRLVLIFDMWHPRLTEIEIATI